MLDKSMSLMVCEVAGVFIPRWERVGDLRRGDSFGIARVWSKRSSTTGVSRALREYALAPVEMIVRWAKQVEIRITTFQPWLCPTERDVTDILDRYCRYAICDAIEHSI